jgi:hypothetical protein
MMVYIHRRAAEKQSFRREKDAIKNNIVAVSSLKKNFPGFYQGSA